MKSKSVMAAVAIVVIVVASFSVYLGITYPRIRLPYRSLLRQALTQKQLLSIKWFLTIKFRSK